MIIQNDFDFFISQISICCYLISFKTISICCLVGVSFTPFYQYEYYWLNGIFRSSGTTSYVRYLEFYDGFIYVQRQFRIRWKGVKCLENSYHHRDVRHSWEYWISFIIKSTWLISTQFSIKSRETNHITCKSIKHRLPYFITHKLINLNWFSIYQLLLLYSTQIYNAFFLTLLLWNVLLRTPKFKSTKSCNFFFFFYTNNTGSITQVNEEFYSYFGYRWISHLINQRDLRENIWDNCLRFAQQLLSWLKMNVLYKALFATKLFTLFCAMCIRMLLLTEIEANRQTIRNNSASVIGAMHWQIMRCSFSNRCIPTNHYMEEIWRSSSFVW